MVHMKVYVAITSNGEIVGTIASGMKEKRVTCEAWLFALDGKGAVLLNSCFIQPRTIYSPAGCKRVTLDTTAPLERAIRFYRKNGFVPTGGVTDFFGMPLYEYAKPLILR